jgi:hopanoid biosynthesis associated RND transporter like protein HpnN
MKTLADTLLGRALGLLADVVIRHRQFFFWPQILLFGLSIIYTVRYLEFDGSRDNLVGSGQKYHQIYQQFKREFPSQDDLVVVVEGENPEKNRQFVERLGAKLDAEAKPELKNSLFTNVMYRNDFPMLGRKALLFASESDLKGLREQMTNFLPFVQKFTQVTNLNSMFEMVNSQILHAKAEDNPENDALMKAMPMLQSIIDQARSSLVRPGTPPSPGIAAMFGAGDQDIYITYSNRIYLVTAQARSDELNGDAVERLRQLTAETEREVPGLNIGITGEPVLEHDEMAQSQKDSALASVVSLVLCALIFIYGYQETGRPLKATFCLIIGLGYTLAFTVLTVGHLNILTITFLPILIGLAIDFGVHLITRYEEELRLGKTEEDAMRKAIVFTGQGIFTGALTTAVAFLAMGLTHFKGIQEMGIICGGGMLICFVPMMTLLPVLLFRGRQNVMDKEAAQKIPLRARLESAWLKRPMIVLGVTVTLILIAAVGAQRVYFDYNLLNMQSAGLPSVVFEKKLITSAGQSLLFAAVVADSADAAVKLEDDLMKLKTVAKIDSMAKRVIGDQVDKLRMIGEIKQDIAEIHFAPTDIAPVNLSALSQTLYSTLGLLGQVAADSRVEPALARQLLDMRDSISTLRRQMNPVGPVDQDVASLKLAAFQQALLNDVRETFRALKDQDNSSPLRAADLPPALRHRFIGITGKYLLQVYPKEDVWQRDKQEEFVHDLDKLVPEVTGTPVQLYYYTKLLKDSYEQAALYSLAAIVLMVLFHFRTISSVFLALLPVGVGFIWLCGWMGYCNVPFNPANIMTLPLVIGIGVTNGIHILNRFAEEKTPSILSKSTGKAVFVSGLTTISGFGSLILGKHQGIRSLGEVMSVGMATCMLAAITFLPAVLSFWQQVRPKKQPSGDNARSTLGREEPR